MKITEETDSESESIKENIVKNDTDTADDADVTILIAYFVII